MKISHTAAYIAVKFYGLTLDDKLGRHFDPSILTFYEKMVDYLPNHLSWYHDSLTSPFWRKVFILSEEMLLPGDLMHIICRKHYITQKVDAALADGIEQVVILGSGFDHLGAYISQKGIHCFELDHDYMIEPKKHFSESAGYVNDHLHFGEIDVRKSSIKTLLLASEEFDRKKKTLFIAEGFFDYLSLSPSENIFNDIRDLNFRNELLTTFFSLDELSLFHRVVFRTGVKLVGEALKFKLVREEFAELLVELGYELIDEISYKEMKDEFLRENGIKLPILSGFYIQHYKPV